MNLGRRFRLSLRTFFVLLTILCVLLGLVGVRLMRSLYKESAIASIRASGGDVLYESFYRDQTSQPHGPRWLRDLAGSCILDDVASVALAGFNVRRPLSDADLQLMTRFPKLERLVLNDCDVSQVSPEAFAALGRSTRLVALYAGSTGMSDDQVAAIAETTQLRELSLERTRISDQSVARLGNVTTLKWLNLFSTQITDAGVENLKQLVDLDEVWLAGTRATDRAIRSLQAVIPDANIVHPAGDRPWGMSPYNPKEHAHKRGRAHGRAAQSQDASSK